MNKKAQQAALANRILPGIQSFAWNADRSLVAVCPFSREILIFETNQKPNISDWRLAEVLREVSLRDLELVGLVSPSPEVLFALILTPSSSCSTIAT